ncbi:hypothetical protein [Niveibacterium sp.]|uniref:hypothetical protein n=1 Tax=Niveibacterium sp. TaxID=2017444 RepID=UPI0035B4835C
MSNSKRTSAPEAAKAAQVLRDPQSSAVQRQIAGSVLSQRATGRVTGPEVEHKAGRVLESNHYNSTTRSLAGSAVSQSDKNRK